MSCRRTEIRSALIALLEGINGVSPYESHPQAFYALRRPFESCQLPCLILPKEEEERETENFRRYLCVLTFHLLAVCNHPIESERLAYLDKMVADVDRAIDSNLTLGLSSYGVQCQVSDVTIERGTDEAPSTAYAEILITTPYRFSRGTP